MTHKSWRVKKYVCKQDKQEFTTEYEAFQHILKHGELITSKLQYMHYFDLEQEELPDFSEDHIFRMLKLLAKEYDAWKLPLNASFMSDNYIDTYESKILSRFTSYAIGFAISKPEEFKKYSSERMVDLILDIRRRDLE